VMGTVSGWRDRFIMPLDSDTMDPSFDVVSLLLVCERKKNNVDVRDKFLCWVLYDWRAPCIMPLDSNTASLTSECALFYFLYHVNSNDNIK
jgi:hypothetical protein